MLRRLILVSIVALTGCVSSAPVATVSRTVNAAKHGQLAAFESQLTDDARATLGSARAMDAIRQKLGGYHHIEIGPPLLVSSNDAGRTYKTVVAGLARRGEAAEAVYTVFLRCTLENQTVHQDETPETCTTLIDDNGIPWQNCTPGTPASDYVVQMESCGVEKIEEK
ncbi:MAG TPA: hypothetical protein VJ901_10210 [Thermoanaerobaculia bacterium]|nr:hypothetical protein [Thermoanaerobaculia bacterium]